MTIEEKDRLAEILLYLYFNNMPKKVIGNAQFWAAINNICNISNVDSLSISKAVRILMASENVPQDDETYYLLKQMGLTVRPIRKISGIYWQKQKEFNIQFETKLPDIRRRIVDVVIKQNIREFLNAIYSVMGIFNEVDLKLLNDAF